MAGNAVDSFLSSGGAHKNAVDSFLSSGGAHKNAVDSFLKKSKNPVDEMASSIGGGVISGANFAGAVLDRVGVPRALDLLARLRQTTQAAIAHDDPLDTFMHHSSREKEDRDRAIVRQKFGAPGDKVRAQFYGLGGGFDDFLIDTATDPLTPLGRFIFSGIGKAGEGLGRVAIGAAENGPQIAKDAAKIAHAISDQFTFGGSAKRELGTERFDAAGVAKRRQASQEEEAARRLTERFDKHIAPLTAEDKRTVYRVLNGEAQITDPASGRVIVAPHVANAVAEGRKLTNDMAALQGNAAARRRLSFGEAKLAPKNLTDRVEPWRLSYAKKPPPIADTPFKKALAMNNSDDVAQFKPRKLKITQTDASRARRYELPENLREFAAPDEQGVLTHENIRANYLPAPHNAEAVSPDRSESTFNLLRPQSPNLLQREKFGVGATDDITKFDDSFRGAIRNAARQATAGRMRASIGVPLDSHATFPGDNALERLFEQKTRATGEKRSAAQVADDLWSSVVNVPKNTVTGFGLKHGLINVPSLALSSEGPGAALEAIANGVRVAKKKGGDRYEALRPGIEGGVITPFADRQNPLVELVKKVPVVGKPLGKASAAANNLTWAIDDAAKQAALRRKLARGMSPSSAAAETMREMINYGDRSNVVKAMSKVAPFATFRMGIPAAIASSTMRHPERLILGDRATQGLLGNGSVQIGTQPDGKPMKLSLTTPTSDVLSMEEPQKYARAMFADPIKAALTAMHVGMPSKRYNPYTREFDSKMQSDYFTYGQPLLPHKKDDRWRSGFLAQQLSGYIPASIGQAALGASGVGEFPAEDIVSQLLGGVLGAHVR